MPFLVTENLRGLNPAASPQDQALFEAAKCGNQERINTALQTGANINAQDRNYHKHSPVQYAVEAGHLEAVKYLIARGANLDQKNIDGNSARDSADILWKKSLERPC